MTTTLESPSRSAVDLDRRLDRAVAAVRISGTRLMLRAAAATGDPVARLLVGGGRDDVYQLHERIRARGPLVTSRIGMTAVTSHALCAKILKDPRFGVRDSRGQAAGGDVVTAAAHGPLGVSFLQLDPPDHTRLRRLAAPAFRPARITGYGPRIEAVAHRLLDAVEGRDGFDLVADYATPLPIAVISELLGIPDVDTDRFAEIGMLIGQSLDGVKTVAQADQVRAAATELADLFGELAAQRRVHPGEDVISLLVAAEDEQRITAQELVATCGVLLLAGFETTVNLIGNSVAALLADPVRWRALAADGGVAEQAVEETLRYDTPVQLTLRCAHTDVDLAGHHIPAGKTLLIDLAAAGRDPAVFTRPDRFELSRYARDGERAADHLAFSSGIHYCLGAPLARLEASIALKALSERLPQLAAHGGARRRAGTIIRGYESFPVTRRVSTAAG